MAGSPVPHLERGVRLAAWRHEAGWCLAGSRTGRFAATLHNTATGLEDPLHLAWLRVVEPHLAVLSGYEIHEKDTRHALQVLRSFLDGFCLIEPAGDLHTEDEIDASFRWLIDVIDRGLRELPDVTRDAHPRTAVASISTSTSGSKR